MNHTDLAALRAHHAKTHTPIPYPENPTPRDVLAKLFSNGRNLWTDWYPEADEALQALRDAGFECK